MITQRSQALHRRRPWTMETRAGILFLAMDLAIILTPGLLAAEAGKMASVFDGETLKGWVPMNEPEFSAGGGVLNLDGGMGWLRLERPYHNFVISFQWRALAPGYDSGLYFRSPLEGKPWPKDYQVNLHEKQVGALVGIEGANGPTPPCVKPQGEWNLFELTVRGHEAALKVNGTEVWRTTALEDREGYIGLQAEKHKFQFREIRLAELPAVAPAADPYAGETKAERDVRMKWWREARFGMFIHWGVYSVPAGTYKGKQVDGIGEWIMHNGKIPVAEYREFAKSFNPVKYDPDEWVRLAQKAGMKYVVITSKHHDGFALFETKASKWNVVDATPYGKDLLKPLAEACRKHGIKLGFYYSQAQDWNNPGGASYSGHWDKAQDGSMDDYIRKVAAVQVREILSNYGPLGVLWWDTPADMTKERADALLPLLRLQPGIIHNNRLGGGYNGDTETPEQFVPPTGYPGRDWETCMTMNDTWGYKSYDHSWKSVESLVRNLVDIASKGGNYLLNVGPTSEGLIPAPSVERLKQIGSWMKVNGEAIHATTASPFKRLPWGRATKKVQDGGATLYLHVFEWPSSGKLAVPGLKSRVEAAYLLADATKKTLPVATDEAGVTVTVPVTAPDKISSTVVLQWKGEIQVEQAFLTQAADGTITLPAAEATLQGGTIQYEGGGDHDNIGYWLDAADSVEWTCKVEKAGKFAVTATIAALQSTSFDIVVGGQTLRASSPVTGSWTKFETVSLGSIQIQGTGTGGGAGTGKTVIAVKPVAAGWNPMNLRALVLKRSE
jgi:alpha-L-fucosidase